MSEKEKANVLSLGLNVSLGQEPRLSSWVECDVGARPGAIFLRGKCALSSEANVSQVVSRVHYPLVTLLMRRDTCRDLESGQILITTVTFRNLKAMTRVLDHVRSATKGFPFRLPLQPVIHMII